MWVHVCVCVLHVCVCCVSVCVYMLHMDVWSHIILSSHNSSHNTVHTLSSIPCHIQAEDTNMKSKMEDVYNQSEKVCVLLQTLYQSFLL